MGWLAADFFNGFNGWFSVGEMVVWQRIFLFNGWFWVGERFGDKGWQRIFLTDLTDGFGWVK